ncbi:MULTISPECIES: hypothetical protein [unclassified Micromonospora]|uniref:hypothetical protein n=1 Tax=unclassified Micromonospora TaxID=2617518 RepID=UPI00362A48FC
MRDVLWALDDPEVAAVELYAVLGRARDARPAQPSERMTLITRLVTLDAAFDALRRVAVEHHLTVCASRRTFAAS